MVVKSGKSATDGMVPLHRSESLSNQEMWRGELHSEAADHQSFFHGRGYLPRFLGRHGDNYRPALVFELHSVDSFAIIANLSFTKG